MSEKYCPKCKKTVGEKDLRCPHCNMRLKVFCHSCGAANNFGMEFCECGTRLLRYCNSCGSANFPDAQVCRKCHNPLEEQVLRFSKKRVVKSNKGNSDNIEITLNQPVITENLETVETINEIENENQISEIQEIVAEPENLECPQVIENVSKEINDSEADNTSCDFSETEEVSYSEIDNNIEDVQEDVSNIQTNDFHEEVIEEEGNLVSEISVEENTENAIESEQLPQEEEFVQEPENLINYSSDIQTTIEEDDKIVYFNDSQQLFEHLANIVQTPNNAVVVGICGEEGVGKSSVIKTFSDSLAEQGIIPIVAEGSELIKVSPFGCVRDALLKLLTLPDLHPDVQSFYSEETKQLFVQNFETLSDDEIINFMNFLYPSMQGQFAEIYVQKEATEALLEKIFISITSKNRAVFIVDNFDLIDSASFSFINGLIKKGLLNNQVKLFVSYRENKSAKLYFDSDFEHQDIFATLYLNNLNEEETLNLIKSFANAPTIPTTVNFAINEKGGGNIFFTEQFLSLLFDVGYMYIDSGMMKFKENEPLPFLPKNIEEVIQLRFDAIQIPALKDSLSSASILGYKFDKTAFAAVVDVSEQQAEELLQKLADLMFIQLVSDYEYSFKNLTMWSVIFEIAQKDARFKIICKKTYYVFGRYALSNPALKAIIAKYRDESETVLQAWRETASICAYLGDVEMYSTALEELLLNSGYNSEENELTEEQLDVMEKFGKLAYKTEPQKAVEYLTAPIIAAKDAGNISKVVDLCGYLIKACYEVSDYNGVIEAVDLLLTTANTQLSLLDKALIKSKKLHALFKIGNCEEGINLANNEVIPPLEEALSKQNDVDFLENVFGAWFDASVNLVNLYALQGNSKSIETADNTAEILQMNNIVNPEYTIRLNISKAFALTVAGRINDSAKVLKSVEAIPEYKNTKFIVCRNLIYAMNLIFSETTENLKEQLYDFAKYSNDNNDIFGKHIFKMMFAWMIYDSGNYERANVIFNDELTYFAKIKTVTGALISWLFIAKSSLASEGAESAEHIAIKALEVAQNPKFSQYHAAVHLQKLIAEINLIKGDIDAAKMYLEKGMLTAKQFGLDLAQVELYRTYTKFMEQSMLQDEKKAEFALKADKIYQAAIAASEKLKVPNLTARIKKEHQTLLEYCSQNEIVLTAS